MNEIHQFDQPTFLIIHEIEKLFVSLAMGLKYSHLIPSRACMVVTWALQNVLCNYPCYLTLITVCKILNGFMFSKTMLSELDRLLHTYLTD